MSKILLFALMALALTQGIDEAIVTHYDLDGNLISEETLGA